MTRLSPDDYLAHIRRNSARFREVLTTVDPYARVPSCPEWSAADLLWHLGEVQWFWAQVISHRPVGPPEDDAHPERPGDHAGLLAFFDRSSADLAGALANADPAESAWSWADDQQDVGFTFRRQAHEALIHRLDAEQAAGLVTPLDPTLAADGVAELVEVMYGGEPPAWGRFEPGAGQVAIELTDVGTTIRVRPGMFFGTDPDSGRSYDGPHVLVVPAEGEAAATISGTAAAVDAWMWKRSDDAEITWTGAGGPRERFLAAIGGALV